MPSLLSSMKVIQTQKLEIAKIERRTHLRSLKISIDGLSHYRRLSLQDKALKSACDSIYFNNLVTRSFIGLHENSNYKKDSRLVDDENINRIKNISIKRFVRLWYQRVFERSKIRNFVYVTQLAIKKVALRRILHKKFQDINQVNWFRNEQPKIMLRSFFRYWGNISQKKNLLRRKEIEFKSLKKSKIKRKYFMLIQEQYKSNTKIYLEFNKALLYLKREYLTAFFGKWKELSMKKRIPLEFQKSRVVALKRRIFEKLASHSSRKIKEREIDSVVRSKKNHQIISKYFQIMKNKYNKRTDLSQRYTQYQTSKRKLYLFQWVEAYNMSSKQLNYKLFLTPRKSFQRRYHTKTKKGEWRRSSSS